MKLFLGKQFEVVVDTVGGAVVIVEHLEVLVLHRGQLLQHVCSAKVHVQSMVFHHFLQLLLLDMTLGRMILQVLVAAILQRFELLLGLVDY